VKSSVAKKGERKGGTEKGREGKEAFMGSEDGWTFSFSRGNTRAIRGGERGGAGPKQKVPENLGFGKGKD